MINTIFSYLDTVAGSSGSWGSLDIVWQSSWANLGGFSPQMLSADVDLSPGAIALHAATTRTYPTVNPRQYEDACWERWSAFLEACPPEGALFCDVDVLYHGGWAPGDPLGSGSFTPADVPPIGGAGVTLLHDGIMPSFLAATPAGLATIRDLFTAPEYAHYREYAQERGSLHLSDMIVLARAAESEGFDFAPVRPCRLFDGVRPGTPPIVHFANDAVRNAGFPSRGAAIRAFARGNGLTNVWGGAGVLDNIQ